MPRFFVPKTDIHGGRLILTGGDARHISGSLRLRISDELVVCDGEGSDYICTVDDIGRDFVGLAVKNVVSSTSEPRTHATLYAALMKGDSLEVVCRKAVELGASKIVPFRSERCVVKEDERRAEQRFLRLSRIAAEAAGQSGRGIIPTVSRTVSFSEMLTLAGQADLPLFFYENETEKGLGSVLSGAHYNSVSIITGPEGGFSHDEAAAALKTGLISVSLGPRIMRAETAPLAALAAVMLSAGDMEPQKCGAQVTGGVPR